MQTFIPDDDDDGDMIDGIVEWLTEDLSLFDRRAGSLDHALERLRFIIHGAWTTEV